MRRAKGRGEIRLRLALPPVKPALDLHDEHVTAPAVLKCRSRVPFPVRGLLHLVENSDVVTPWNFSNKLLDDLWVRPGLGKGSHIKQVRARESPHLRKFRLQVRRRSLDHLRTPALLLLPLQDVPADLPMQEDEFAVYRERRPDLRLLSAPLVEYAHNPAANF